MFEVRPSEALGIRRAAQRAPNEEGRTLGAGDQMKILSPFNREFWIQDEDVRKAVGRVPEAGTKAMHQAQLSAIALEGDREELRADLLQRLRENKEQRALLDAALDELDALRILERAS